MFVAIALTCVVAGFVAGALYFIISRRRQTSSLAYDTDKLPPIADSLPTLAGITGASVHTGNRAALYQNSALFEPFFADIREARCTVHLETFVWAKGELERRVVDALCRKAAEGVCVRLLIDAVGGIDADPAQLERLKAAGVELRLYCKPHWWNWKLGRLNHRTHRKLLIVDGRIGYAFGHGIRDEWLGDAEDERHWRDTGVRLEGPVVHALQSVFMKNWIEETQFVPAGSGCFPVLEERGEIMAHVVSSEAGDALSAVALLYTLAIACARKEILIQNPYFVPNASMVTLLCKMVQRGVAVKLMVPGKYNDSRVVRRASCRLYAKLLEAGVRLYEFQPTLLHQKVVIVDGLWAHIGSTNFDTRSLALNEEVGIGLLDAELATELRTAFERDLQRCREIRREDWQRRPWYDGAVDWMAYQLHDWL